MFEFLSDSIINSVKTLWGTLSNYGIYDDVVYSAERFIPQDVFLDVENNFRKELYLGLVKLSEVDDDFTAEELINHLRSKYPNDSEVIQELETFTQKYFPEIDDPFFVPKISGYEYKNLVNTIENHFVDARHCLAELRTVPNLARQCLAATTITASFKTPFEIISNTASYIYNHPTEILLNGLALYSGMKSANRYGSNFPFSSLVSASALLTMPTLISAYGEVGAEFFVTTNTVGDQIQPVVVPLQNNRFVVAWSEDDGSNTGIFAQIFANDGSKVGNQFQINTYTNNIQSGASIARLSNNNFVVTWQSVQVSSAYDVFARIFNGNDGAAMTGEFLVDNLHSSGWQVYPTAVRVKDRFVIAWLSEVDIYGQLFDNNGNRYGSEFLINTNPSTAQCGPYNGRAVTSADNGNFLVVWHKENAGVANIYGQLFNENAAKLGNEIQFTNNNLSAFAAANFLNNNSFVVEWYNVLTPNVNGNLKGIIYNATSLTPLTNVFDVNAHNVTANYHAIKIKDNYFLSLCDAYENEPNVYGRIFHQDIPITNDFRINDFVNGTQANSFGALLDNGDVVIVWISSGQDGSGWGIYGKIYTAEEIEFITNPVDIFRINNYTAGDQTLVNPYALKNGFVAVWTSNQNGGADLYAQVFDDNANRIGLEFRVTPSTIMGSNIYLSQKASELTSGNIALSWQIYAAGTPVKLDAKVYNQYQISVSNQTLSFSPGLYSDQPCPLASIDNNFVIAYGTPGISSNEVYAEMFDSNQQRILDTMMINTFTTNNQMRPSVTKCGNNNYVFAWQSLGQAANWRIYGRIFNANLTALTNELLLSTATDAYHNSYPSLYSLSNGNFLMQWGPSTISQNIGIGAYYQIFNCEGGAVSAAFTLAGGVLPADDGGFWNYFSNTTNSEQHLYAKKFNSTAAKISDTFLIMNYGTDQNIIPLNPLLLNNGNMLVTWQQNNNNTGWDVYGKILSLETPSSPPTITSSPTLVSPPPVLVSPPPQVSLTPPSEPMSVSPIALSPPLSSPVLMSPSHVQISSPAAPTPSTPASVTSPLLNTSTGSPTISSSGLISPSPITINPSSANNASFREQITSTNISSGTIAVAIVFPAIFMILLLSGGLGIAGLFLYKKRNNRFPWERPNYEVDLALEDKQPNIATSETENQKTNSAAQNPYGIFSVVAAKNKQNAQEENQNNVTSESLDVTNREYKTPPTSQRKTSAHVYENVPSPQQQNIAHDAGIYGERKISKPKIYENMPTNRDDGVEVGQANNTIQFN